jgi:hypothetical protein
MKISVSRVGALAQMQTQEFPQPPCCNCWLINNSHYIMMMMMMMMIIIIIIIIIIMDVFILILSG